MSEDHNLQNLLYQFSSMTTTDHEVLVSQFRSRVGDHETKETAESFLEMNNWNLQAAVSAYYELQENFYELPNMSVVKHVTITEGENFVSPGSMFTKIWRVLNCGEIPWPVGTRLVFTGGSILFHTNDIPVYANIPGEISEISVDMSSPLQPGRYVSRWRLVAPCGSYFGEELFVGIYVVEDEAQRILMQQPANFNL